MGHAGLPRAHTASMSELIEEALLHPIPNATAALANKTKEMLAAL